MLQNILVPLDGSYDAASVIPVAARLARATAGSVVLLQSVFYPLENGEIFTEPQVAVKGPSEEDRARVISYLTRLAASEALAGVPTAIDCMDRPPVEAILAGVRRHRAHIVVMYSSGIRGVERWITGSIAREVVRHLPVPALVLRTEESLADLAPGGIRPIVVMVALDGSASAEAGLKPAALLCAALSAPAAGALHLVRVLHFPPIGIAGYREQDAARKLAESEAQVYLRSIERRLREGDFAKLQLAVTSSIVASSNIAHSLSEFATNCTSREGLEEISGCHVITMATHGRSGLQHLLAGSVTERVFDATRQPMLIVRSSQPEKSYVERGPAVNEIHYSTLRMEDVQLH